VFPIPRIIAVANQKGGVGKTATVAALGAALAEAKRRVLLVDLDPQANLSLSCGLHPTDGRPGAYEVLMDPGTPAMAAIVPSAWERLAVLPSTNQLASAEVELVHASQRTARLSAKLSVIDGFDYVLVDTPPSLGFLTLNALTAATSVIIPLQASFLALEGLRQLMTTISAVREHGNPGLAIAGIVLTMFDHRTLHAQQVRQRVSEHFGDLLFATPVRRSVIFDYATVAGEPVVYHSPTHPCSQAYRDLAKELIARAEST